MLTSAQHLLSQGVGAAHGLEIKTAVAAFMVGIVVVTTRSHGTGSVFIALAETIPLIFLFVLSAAIGALKIPAVTAFMDTVLGYLPNVIAAVIIFVIAGAVAAAVGGAAAKLMGDTPTGKIVGTAIPALVMGIAVFMVLNQLRIAPAIVQITYIALLGSVALGAALAFGLGGRDVAGQLLSQAYDQGRQNKDQVKQDMQTGKERGQQQADRARDKAQQKLDATADESDGFSQDPPGSAAGAYRR